MFKSLLLAVDVADAEGVTRCSEAAVSMARSEGAVLHVVNVVPDSGMSIVGSMLGPDHAQKATAQAKAGLEAWAKDAIPADIDAKLHIAHGSIYDQIIRAADKYEVDGIFVGAYRPGLQDYLIGPNAARVARHATQSVFVIR